MRTYGLVLGSLVLGCFVLCGQGAEVFAAAGSAPQTGLEGGYKHSYGPDAQGRRDKRYAVPMPNDAYGNPITPTEPKETSRQRIRHGAYGGARSAPQQAPLPDLPEHDAGWKFK